MLSDSGFVSLVGAQCIAPSSRRELCIISIPLLLLAGRGIKPYRIRTSANLLPQLLYNPHLQEPFRSAGNNRLTATEFARFSLLESPLTRTLRKCGKQTPYKSIGIRTCKNCTCNLFRIRTYKKGRGGESRSKELSPEWNSCEITPAHDSLLRQAFMRHNPPAQAQRPHSIPAMGRIQ
jgi:hypothetical protein